MDPLRFCIAFIPLALYCLWVAALNLRRHPRVVSGAVDLLVLAAGISGLMVVGPLELFFPTAAADRLGAFVWLLLLLFYGLSCSLVALLGRPRWVVYHITLDQLRPALANVTSQFDREVRWAGDSLILPSAGLQLRLEAWATLRNVSLIATGETQADEAWDRLGQALRTELAGTESAGSRWGLVFASGGIALLAACTFLAWQDPAALAQEMRELLRML